MKKALAMFIMLCAAVMLSTGLAFAQDVLGAHNVNGHGCASCHSPHSGNAAYTSGGDSSTGLVALWGRQFIGKTYTTPTGTFTTPASLTGFIYNVVTGSPDNDPMFKTAVCLTCHDGSIVVAGMTGHTVETNASGVHAPTWLAADPEGLQNDHPVHVTYSCTDSHNWDCFIDPVKGTIYWGNSAQQIAFVANYGHTATPSGAGIGATRINSTGTLNTVAGAYVECTTCHNQHSMTSAKQSIGQAWITNTTGNPKCSTAQVAAAGGCYAGGTSGYYPTSFFVKGWYNTSPSSNSAAQFCRQCHAGESNEWNGVYGVATN
jgi:hypothetical protein